MCCFFLIIRHHPRSTRPDTLFPYTTLFRSFRAGSVGRFHLQCPVRCGEREPRPTSRGRALRNAKRRMTLTEIAEALLLGIVEGLTEFIPVSSTGHLILLGDLLGFQGPPGFVFEVVIQLGAILAVSVVYGARLSRIVSDLPHSAEARRFVLAVLIAFLPAAVIGFFAHEIGRAHV